MSEPHLNPSTRTLLRAFLEGERSAEGELFERHRPQLLKHARSHPGMRALKRLTSAEEVVSEAFVRALTSNLLRGFEDRGKGSLRNVLMRIVDRVMVDMKRRFEAQKRGGSDLTLSVDQSYDGKASMHERLPSPDTTPTQAAQGADLLRFCREQLTDRERAVWELAVEQGRSLVDVARQLDITESVARSLLFRARERLKTHLGEADQQL